MIDGKTSGRDLVETGFRDAGIEVLVGVVLVVGVVADGSIDMRTEMIDRVDYGSRVGKERSERPADDFGSVARPSNSSQQQFKPDCFPGLLRRE